MLATMFVVSYLFHFKNLFCRNNAVNNIVMVKEETLVNVYLMQCTLFLNSCAFEFSTLVN